ncbi:unnamed protein product [Lactuca saligna]|uniref:Uncharacterized protein n=1 Tax=Lactuca saligna TaxID=75948 RepID=A0AA35ZJY2_LACSI|nr:unnamed protein product [Lactuca saligna]
MTQATPATYTPPEVSTFESDKDENRTPDILENTYNVDLNVNIGVTILEPTSTYVPFVSPDANFIVSDELDSLDDFSIPDFNFRIESDDDVDLSALIIRAQKTLATNSTKKIVELNEKIEKVVSEEALSGLRFGLQRDNTDHHTFIANSILKMHNDLDHANRIMTLAESTYKVNVLKEQLKNASIQLSHMSKDLLLVKGQNFEINKCPIRIVDAPYANSTFLAPGLQGGDEGDEDDISVNKDEIPKVNLRNPYETWKMANTPLIPLHLYPTPSTMTPHVYKPYNSKRFSIPHKCFPVNDLISLISNLYLTSPRQRPEAHLYTYATMTLQITLTPTLSLYSGASNGGKEDRQ